MSTAARPKIRPDWTPHPGQRDVLDSDARFRVVACGRRWGKTEVCAREAARYLGEPDTLVWWVAPTYDIADIGFDAVEKALPRMVIDGEPKKTKPKSIDLVNGSRISFRSADREDSLRGEGLDLLILDEAAMIPERAWTAELRPTLSDTLGDMVAISTPKGRGWFYRWFERGATDDHPDVESWQAPTYDNPHVPDEEIDAAQREQPGRVFEQEYLAEFIDESGGVFTDVDDSVEDYPLEETTGEPPYAIGVDFARHEDWTVAIVLDATGRVVDFERVQSVSWPQIQTMVEKLADAGVNVNPVKFSPKRKRELIENLVTRLENGELTLPDVPQLVHELQIFEYDVTPSGNVRYNAPEGFHDDCVDSLALASSALDRLGVMRQREEARENQDDTGVSGI